MPNSRKEGIKLAGAYIPKTKYNALAELAIKNNRTLADQCRAAFDQCLAGNNLDQPPAPPAAPCKCWDIVDVKLASLGVKLADSLTSFSTDFSTFIRQLPTEPLNGKFKASMPRKVGFSFCPFCGQKLPTAKEAA